MNFIDASYIKTENTTILEWLQIIKQQIFKVGGVVKAHIQVQLKS